MKTIIYGAGNYAKRVYEYLYAQNLARDVLYFAVTNLENNPDSLYGVPVKSVDSVRSELKKNFVIIAVSPKKEGINKIIKMCDKEHYRLISQAEYWDLPRETEALLYSLPLENNLIFISCFQGQEYKCNMKYIAEYILHSGEDFKIIWNTRPDFFERFTVPSEIKKVEKKSIEYRRAIHTAKVIIANDEMKELGYKKKGQYVINTWHGTGPFKKVNASIANRSMDYLESLRDQQQKFDLYISNSQDNTQMFRESFLYDGEIAEWGSPRIDILFQNNKKKIVEIRDKLGIPQNKSVVLFAPTFRENALASYENYILKPKMVKKALNERFKSDFVFLYRYHHHLYHAGQTLELQDGGVDVTDYLDIMELLIITDVLITDYSSVMWDFSLMKKPVFLYQPDLDEYLIKDKGLYMPVDKWPYPKANSQKGLCDQIKQFDEKAYLDKLHNFFENDKSYDDGHACERLFNRIKEVCGI